MKTVRFADRDCVVEKSRYTNGRPALVLNDPRDGEQIAVATVNLPDVPAGPNEVFIKDYSENAGMLAALEAAGVVRATGDVARSGFVTIPRCELLPPFRERSLAEMVAEKSAAPASEPHDKDRGMER
jgi:hypothetical protein